MVLTCYLLAAAIAAAWITLDWMYFDARRKPHDIAWIVIDLLNRQPDLPSVEIEEILVVLNRE